VLLIFNTAPSSFKHLNEIMDAVQVPCPRETAESALTMGGRGVADQSPRWWRLFIRYPSALKLAYRSTWRPPGSGDSC